MPEILIQVRNKTPVIVGDVRQIVADNSDYTIRFIFDDLWEDGEKTVYFVRANGYVFAPEKTVDDAVSVPVQTDVGMMTWLCVGVQQGDIKTSRPCEIKLLSSIADCIDDDAVQPDESMWQDVLQRLEYLEEHGGGTGGTGGTSFTPGNALELTPDGTLNVITASDVEENNTLPITAAAVYTEIGNIDVLLGTI